MIVGVAPRSMSALALALMVFPGVVVACGAPVGPSQPGLGGPVVAGSGSAEGGSLDRATAASAASVADSASVAKGPPEPVASAVPAATASSSGPPASQMVFPSTKLRMAGKSLSEIGKAELSAAFGKHCPPGFRPVDGVIHAFGRWDIIGIHCGKGGAYAGAHPSSIELYRPRPRAQMQIVPSDAPAGPRGRLRTIADQPGGAYRYDEPAGVLVYIAAAEPGAAEGLLRALVKEE